MKKIIIIGELGIDIEMIGDRPAATHPAGRLLNAAAMLGAEGLPVVMVGDMGRDPMGDIVEKFLTDNNVDITSVDRYTDGLTPVTFYFDSKAVRYAQEPSDGLDVVWPRVEPGDIVVYGGYYAIAQRVRPRLMQLLAHAAEMKAVMVYLPGFLQDLAPRITRVMPSLLENMEMASLLVTRQSDLKMIYGDEEGADAEKCYRNHAFYYVPAMINIDPDNGLVTTFDAGAMSTRQASGDFKSLQWMARFTADIIKDLYNR